jgi:dipeptidyl aminopeptidase/acylaminoacyl peptidase
MKRFAVVCFALVVCLPTALAAQEEKDIGAKLDRLERQVRSLRFAIQAAEQQSLELTFRFEAQGVARYEKIRYTSSADGRIIPAHVWTPLDAGDAKLPALVWIHGGVHGHLAFYYWRLIREMLEEGYVVLAPEYRGSTHHGRGLYNAIDYGGMEVEDCISGRDWLVEMHPNVDTERIAMIGWSHGGFITMHSLYRAPEKFVVGVNVVGVSDLVERMGYKSESYRRTFAEQKGFGGYAYEKLERYIERSPAHQAHRLQTPVLIHLATNDTDVRINETMHLIDALKAAGKDFEYEIYEDPPGGHSFNRINSATAAESWQKIKAYLAEHLK